MDMSYLTQLGGLFAGAAFGTMIGRWSRTHAVARLASIKALMREQNDALLASGDREYRNAWLDVWLKLGPHEQH